MFEEPATATPSNAPATAAPRTRKLKLCLVEDNEDIRETLRDIFELAGHEVVTADDGPAGVRLILAAHPDIAMIDLGLPGLDGVGVAREVRARTTDNPVRLVALTGYGSAEDRERTRAAGFDEHVLKPVDPDDLLRCLAEVASRTPGGPEDGGSAPSEGR